MYIDSRRWLRRFEFVCENALILNLLDFECICVDFYPWLWSTSSSTKICLLIWYFSIKIAMLPIQRHHKKALLDVIAVTFIDIATQYLNKYYNKKILFLANEAANCGKIFVHQILQVWNFWQSLNEFRMPVCFFLHLSKHLQKNGKFGDNRNASTNQKFAIF